MASGIYGLSGSGMDIDELVKGMMKTQQAKYDKLYKQKTVETWRKESYNTVYKSMYNFRYNTLSNYKMQSTMSAKTATTTDSSTVTAKALGDAVQMTHDIAVKQLASNAYLQSKEKITRDNVDSGTSIKLSDIAGVVRPAGAEDSDIALAFSIDDGANGKQYVKYSYKDIEDGKTLNDLVSDINKLGGNIQASYDNNRDSISLYNKIGGESNKIELNIESEFMIKGEDGKIVPVTVSDDAQKKSATFINNLHLVQYDSEKGKLGTKLEFAEPVDGKYTALSQTGKSAIAIIDGKEYKSESNTISAGSVVYTLNKVSKNNGTEAVPDYESTKVTINSDNESIVKNVKKFVEDYNKMIDEINTQIYQKYDSTYLPLTDDEKSSMSEEQIKKWEEKAKTGLLAADPVLKETVNSMRTALASIISGTGNDYNSLASIGITTTDYTEHGKIQLDEDKLNKALTADPDAAYKLFGTLTDTTSERGIAHKLSDVMNTALSKVKEKAGTTAELGDESNVDLKIKRINSQMTTLKTRMEKQQSSLYKRFNAMETAIAQLNQQASYVTSAFGSSS